MTKRQKVQAKLDKPRKPKKPKRKRNKLPDEEESPMIFTGAWPKVRLSMSYEEAMGRKKW